ncbi:chromatin/chromatin-binding, or -regulatory protein [Lithospermum erythrorhizon]|uniref:Chromatin/chromatin-binding, or -regulatory protein n=1 Tax=Lithospermum erythrorhizon TaxID=34254 RepID=A0AAV3PZ84_LITER
MHGFSSGSVLVVNAEVDSMGGVVEGGGVGSGTITSPQRVVIEKVQAELRQEHDVREERRRELEFLEKGGDPLEFKLSTTFSLSRQSTSVTDHQPYQFLSSEEKGSFARPASPHGDSVESSGRPVVRPLCDPDCADNLMLFEGENEFPEVDKNLTHPSKCIVTPSEQSSQLDVHANSKELKSSATFNVPRNSYRRRSRPNRDSSKTGSNNAALARSTSLSSRHSPIEVKGLSSDVEFQMNQTVLVNPKPVPPNPVESTISKSSEKPSELDGVKTAELTANASEDLINDHDNKQMLLSPGVVCEDQECSHIKKDFGSAVLECEPCEAITKLEDLATCGQKHGCGGSNHNMNDLCVDVQKNSVVVASKVLDSESSCTDMGSNTDGCNSNELYTDQKGAGNVKEHILVPQMTPVKEEATDIEEQKKTQVLDSVVLNDDSTLNNQNQENELQCGAVKEVKKNAFVLGNTVKDPLAVQSVKASTTAYSETCNPVTGSGTALIVSNQESVRSFLVELSEPKPSIANSAVTMDGKESNAKAVSKADEDAILKEASVIEAKHKRIVELSAAAFPVENFRKSHWDYVLDEMAWLANDFAQERLWKMTAAARLCYQVAYTSQFRFQEKHHIMEQKRVAHLLSDAVIQFWNSVQDSNKDMPLPCYKDSALTIRQYAVNFLKFNSSCIQPNQAEAPVTPDRNSDLGMVGMSWDDNSTEDNLFYLVPFGAMKTYRKSIESHVAQYEKTGSSLQEEVETSAFNAVTAFGAFHNAYEDEEGETSTYDCDTIKSSRHGQKKRKILPNGYGRRSYEVLDDLMYKQQCIENKLGTQEDEFKGKRPASLNVSIPTKRVRTASRQRVLSPFTAGTSGYVPLPIKADASSGDTSSFHDDQSILYGGSIMPNNMEVESVRDFGKQLPFDSSEVSKPRKKKKRKHLGSAYEQRWQVDSNFQSDQRDHSKKRSEGYQLESNGCGGLSGQHVMKKPKVMRPSALENTFDNIPPVAGSVPSPVASQMSNMPNPNIKIIGGGERGRKTKASKVSSRQQGSGSPWLQFEDQALIVLVHDLGPNWELVSDAINCTLQFKSVHRKPSECKERHIVLMDKTTGDGADSAEDSGSSQPYPSTLPGIPKGSARQLFQQLQRPIEEETLKSHFEKIIKIVQKQHYRKSQNGNNDPKQLQQPHSSHMLALSQVCPNNLNGVPVLTPFDLCDQTTSNPEFPSLGYQSPHNNCLPMSNQASAAPVPALQGPATMLDGNNFPSPGSLYPYVRDGRLAIPRSASLSIDEQQKMQQYNQMFPARNIQQPSLTSSEPGTDRGMRMLPGANGIGAMGGVNRSGPVPRPGFQTMAPSPTLNSGIVHSSGMIMKPSPVNMLSGSRSGQGNSVMRARDSLHMMRPTQSRETQRHILASEFQMQVPQANQGVLPYVSDSNLANQSVPSRLLQQQPQMLNHRPQLQGVNQASPQHQAYALRLMKERQLQRIIHQQQKQQQFVSSNAVLPHVQPPAQLPKTTSLPNSSQVQPQISSPPVPFSASVPSSSLPSVPHHQHKHQMPPQGLVRNLQIGGSGLANHVGKQKRQPQQQQRPQSFQQAGRRHPEQRQQPLSQPHTKHVKGVGRGNLIQQSTSVESCLPNGLSTTPGNPCTERSEQAIHSVQGQGLYMESPLNSVQNTKKLGSPNSLSQCQPMYPGQVAPASNNIEIEASHSDYKNSNLTPVSSVCHQSVAPMVTDLSNQQQQQMQSHQETANHNLPAVQLVLQVSRQVNSDMTTKLQNGESPIDQCNIRNNVQPDGTTSQAGINATKGIPVVSFYADQRNASEQLHDSVTSSAPSSFASAVTHLADGADKAVESLGCKQSSQQDPSPLSQPQQPASPISQLQQ